jgi:tetratricopeptide (TPR) repeat protein
MQPRDRLAQAGDLYRANRLAESGELYASLLDSELRAYALYGLALVSRRQGDRDRAQALLEQTLGVDRRNPDALAQLARIHLEKGNQDAATRLAGESLALNPRHPVATATIWGLTNQPTAGALAGVVQPGEAQPPRQPSEPAPRHVPPRPPTSASSTVGTVEDLKQGVAPYRGKPAALQVWSFRLQGYDADGRPLPLIGVEMRGMEITGTLDNGDWVEIPESARPGEGLRPKKLYNLTSNDMVNARNFLFGG